ncbi:hypothetical protein ACQKND_06555 [Viridibacillus arvi]|uniref:hypothetical protein n=1 Tax=Viridibacillus arvi TaxID=263475 RepID=UPI003CFCCB30
MVNNKLKLVKSATAFVIGAAVLTGSFAAAGSDTAFAKSSTSVKVSNGKLVYKSTGKVVKGYKTYNKALYKDGKKLTGLYKKTYYKAGKKATGTYKSVYYKAGKAFTGVTNKTYYKAGKKATGTYKNVYYKSGKAYTGVVNKTYYKAGKKATGLYKGVYYKTGKAATGIYKDQLYISGNLSKGLELYKDQLYKDASLNKGLALYKDQLYKDAVLNKGFIKFEDKFYFDAALANGTYVDADNVERAVENGIEVGAKVKAVEAINATEVKITFNKKVQASDVITSGTPDLVKAANVAITAVDGQIYNAGTTTAKLSENGRELTLTSVTAFEGRYKVVVENVRDAKEEKIEKFDSVITIAKDTTAPSIASTEKVNAVKTTVNFSEPLSDKGTWTFKFSDGTAVPAGLVTASGLSTDKKSLDLTFAGTPEQLATYAGKTVVATVVGALDGANNIINPNPSTVSFTIGQKDGVAPTATVTAKDDATLVVNFSEEVQGFATATSSEAETRVLVAAGTGLKTVKATKIEQDSTDKNKYYVTLDQSALDAVDSAVANVTVKATGVTDLSGQAMAADHTQIVTISKDTVAPKFVSSKIETIAGLSYLTLTFDKDLKSASPIAVDGNATSYKDYVTDSKALGLGAQTIVNKKSVRVALADTTFNSNPLVTGTKYNFNIIATDATAVGNNSASTPVEFTFGGTVSSDTPKVNTAIKASNKTVTVTFDTALDGATATNAANYKIAGTTVTNATLDTTKKVVTLTLGTTEHTGNQAINITGVKSADGIVMEAYNNFILLNENVAPTVKLAKVLTTKTIEVTLSEDLLASTVTGATTNDFVVKSGSTILAYATVTAGTSADKVVITLDADLTTAQLNTALTLEVKAADLTDAAGNKVTAATGITIAK